MVKLVSSQLSAPLCGILIWDKCSNHVSDIDSCKSIHISIRRYIIYAFANLGERSNMYTIPVWFGVNYSWTAPRGVYRSCHTLFKENIRIAFSEKKQLPTQKNSIIKTSITVNKTRNFESYYLSKTCARNPQTLKIGASPPNLASWITSKNCWPLGG